MANHICNVDCDRQVIECVDIHGNERVRVAHIMYAAEPSSAAGRYQWELNRDLLNQGRRAWRASGQGQSRACREWDAQRYASGGSNIRGSRRFMASVGSPWSDEHMLRTFNAWTLERGL